MLCALTVRKLKPGSYEDFRNAWEPDEWPEAFARAYHVRSVEDENQVVSFGFFDGTLDQLKEFFERHGEGDRQQRIAEFVESTGLDGMFEVLDEVAPPAQ